MQQETQSSLPLKGKKKERITLLGQMVSSAWMFAIRLTSHVKCASFSSSIFSWNWRTVLEDDRMHVCVATAELVHPCHYDQSFQHGFR
jgi:hypothetical protein